MTDLKQLIELGRRLQSCLLHNDCDMSALEINVALKEFDLPNLLPLLEELERLREKLEKVYNAGRSGISYVGKANYDEREREANKRLDDAMYGEANHD